MLNKKLAWLAHISLVRRDGALQHQLCAKTLNKRIILSLHIAMPKTGTPDKLNLFQQFDGGFKHFFLRRLTRIGRVFFSDRESGIAFLI